MCIRDSFHSDRGYQYTNRTFHHKLKKAGMTLLGILLETGWGLWALSYAPLYCIAAVSYTHLDVYKRQR